MSEMQIKAAGDSITVIDSLVLTNRLKNTDLTNALARRSLIHARVIGKDDAFLKAYNIIGNAWSLSRMDSAFFYYSKALGMKPGKTHYPEKPMILYNLAMLNVAASNPKNAIILLDSAMWEAGKMKKFNVVSNALNSLGNIYKDLGNDSVARIMYDSAFQIANIHQLSLQMGVSLGSITLLEVDPWLPSISMQD
jgi:tetratricopeptide (TPR) repeat protein